MTGYLSDFRVFAPSSPDLTGVRTVLATTTRAISRRRPTRRRWSPMSSRPGSSAPTIGRPCVSRSTGRTQSDCRSNSPRLASRPLTSTPTRRARSASAFGAAFHDGGIRVVCNVGVLTTGVDWDVRALILARPTKSEMLFVQIIGRGLRTAEGKDYCLILDHSDNHTRLGFVTDIGRDRLDDGTTRAPAQGRARHRSQSPARTAPS